MKAKAKDRFRYHVLVKAPLEADLGAALAAAAASLPSNMGSNMALDVDAYDLI